MNKEKPEPRPIPIYDKLPDPPPGALVMRIKITKLEDDEVEKEEISE